MIKELIRHDLDTKKAFIYVKEQLCSHALSQELKALDFEKGHFFTLLPEDADLERIYDFYGGCILPQNPTLNYKDENIKSTYTWIPTLKKEMSHFIFEKMKNKENYACVFEEVMQEITDPHIDFFHQYGLLYLNEMYYFLNNTNATQELVLSAIRECNALWHHLFILTEIDNIDDIGKKNTSDKIIEIGKKITLDNIKDFCKKIKLLVIGAYDGEGFVLWEPNSN